MGDGSNFISGPDSPAWDFPAKRGVDPTKLWVQTHGFGAHTVSAVGEVKLRFHPLFGLLLSGRADKNDMTNLLLTPRVVLTSEMGKRAALRLIWQRAQRMNTAEQLFLETQVNHETPDPEEINSYEGIFTVLPTESLSLSLSVYYSKLGIIGFDGTTSTSPVVGDLKAAGGELEASFANKTWRGGISHAFAKQLDWKLREGFTSSGISYSDYNFPTRDVPTVILKSEGNDLNNWANHATKLFVNYGATSWLVLHLDTRVFWKFEGSRDGLTQLKKAAAGSASEAQLTPILDRVDQEGAYGIDFRVNLSARLAFTDQMSLTIYGMNLTGVGGFKRYGFDAGNTRIAPARVQFVREPVTVGATLEYAW
jgi:hypothetical protein